MFLIAEATSSILDSEGAKLTFAVLVLGAIGYGLSILRDLRKNVTSEVRMQMAADDAESESQKIPQPLVTKKHVDFTPYSEHKDLKLEFEKLREQRRVDVGGLHKKIEDGLKETRADIALTAEKIASLQTTTDSQSSDINTIKGDVRNIHERIDKLPERTINLLRSTKGLIE